MPLLDIFQAVRDYTRDERNAHSANTQKILWRLGDVFLRTWDLGFTAFGGPPVHFRIAHQRFVEGKNGKTPWIDEQIVRDYETTERLSFTDMSLSIKSSSP